MADIRGNEGVNFGGKRGVNASDPRQDKDVVNFRTLKVHIASISGSTSTGSTSVSVSSIGDGYPVYAGLNAGTYEFRSFSAGTPNLQMYCGNTITYSLNDNINIVGLTASTITANTVNSGQFLSAGTPIEFYLKERIWTGSTGVNSTIRNNGTGNLAAGQASFVAGSNSKAYGVYSTVLNGASNVSNGNYNLILNGFNNNIQTNSYFNTILNGTVNTINSLSSYSSILGGNINTLVGLNSSIINSKNSYLSGNYSSILGGSSNAISGNYSVIIGGSGINTAASNTATVPYLRITNAPNGGMYMLTIDNSGYVFKQSIPGGAGYISGATNIGGTHGIFSNINLGILRFKSLSGGSNIIITSSSTENAISLSSNVVTSSISATTVSGGTFYSGQTPLGTIIISEASRYWTGSTGIKAMVANNQTGNIASGTYSIAAGRNNKSYGTVSTIIGGRNITLYESYSFAGSGYGLKGKSKYNFLGSGRLNNIYTNSLYGSIINGRGNKLTGHSATIINGYGHNINIPYIGTPQYLVGATIAGGRLNQILFKGQSFIGAGAYNKISGDSSFRSFIGAGTNNMIYNTRSFIGAGYGNKIFAAHSSMLSSINSKIYASSSSVIAAGSSTLSGVSVGRSIIIGGISQNLVGDYSMIGIGLSNHIKFSNHSVILAGRSNTAETLSSFSLIGQGKNNKITTSTYSSILNGTDNTINATSWGSILAGINNELYNADSSNIIAGAFNNITNVTGSSILAGSVISAISGDTAYAKHLAVVSNATLLKFAGGGTQYLTVDNNGAVGVSAGTGGGGGGGSTVNNGINTFTAGTSSFQSVNVTDLSINTLSVSGISVFTGTLSGGSSFSANTLYSGSTDLYSIFAPIGSNTPTYIQPGLNTYTGGTSTNPTVNVSALTISTLTASGNSVFTGTLSGGSSFSASTIYSGSTDLYSIFTPIGSNIPTYVQPGLNTYTGGTSTSPTVNVSALTINTIVASGDSRFTTLSATTFTANTITASTISANTLYVYGSLNQTQQTYLSTIFSTTSASLTDVTGMSFTIQPFEVWQFHISGQMSGSTANGQNHALSIPTNAVLRANDISNTNSVTAFRTSILNSNNAESSTVCAAANNIMGFEIKGVVSGSSTSGTIQLRLRANTAGNTESIQDGAYLIAQRIR